MQVGTLASGEIDYDELRELLAANSARPAIINVNIGTTVRGAVDDLDRVLQILTVRHCGPSHRSLRGQVVVDRMQRSSACRLLALQWGR